MMFLFTCLVSGIGGCLLTHDDNTLRAFGVYLIAYAITANVLNSKKS
jgi:hypothetical protein